VKANSAPAANKSNLMDDLFGDQSGKSATPSRPASGRARANVNFEDDDPLAALDGKKKPATMSAASKSSFMDSLFGNDKKDQGGTSTNKNDFVLDDKYKKPAPGTFSSSFTAGVSKTSAETTQGRRRRGGPELAAAQTAAKPSPDVDLDDKLFQGTSLARTATSAPLPATKEEPPPSSSHPAPQAPAWMSGAQPAPMAAPVTPQMLPAPTTISAENQPLVDAYQEQLRQLQDLERQQQEQFRQDLQRQKAQLEAKQAERAAAMEQQRAISEEQVRLLQERQLAAVQSQRERAQVLLTRAQQEAELDLAARSEMLKAQLALFENSGSSKREDLDEVEAQFRQREDRLRQAHAEHVEDLETQLENLQKRHRQLIEQHANEMSEEKERRVAALKSQAEEHEANIKAERERFKARFEGLSRVKDNVSASNAVSALADTVSNNVKEMNALKDKMEEKDVRDEVIKQRDEQIKDLSERLQRMKGEREREETDLKANIEVREEKVNEKMKHLEERESALRKKEAELRSASIVAKANQDAINARLQEERRRIEV